MHQIFSHCAPRAEVLDLLLEELCTVLLILQISLCPVLSKLDLIVILATTTTRILLHSQLLQVRFLSINTLFCLVNILLQIRGLRNAIFSLCHISIPRTSHPSQHILEYLPCLVQALCVCVWRLAGGIRFQTCKIYRKSSCGIFCMAQTVINTCRMVLFQSAGKITNTQ